MILTALGIVHTLLSLVAIVAAVITLRRQRQISTDTPMGRLYIWSLVLTCLTGFPILRHGVPGPPHALGVVTLAAFAVAALAGKTRLFGPLSAYVETISYSATVLFLGISTVTETLTRVPPGAPLVPDPQAPIFKILYVVLLIAFVLGLALQIRMVRGRKPGLTASG
jgi:hypothetical protein